jgi:glucose/arabinose dehydrogenase
LIAVVVKSTISDGRQWQRIARRALKAGGSGMALVHLRTVWLAATIAALGAFAPAHVHGQSPIRLAPLVTSGLVSPLFVTHAGDGSGRLFILEQEGRIRIWSGGTLRQSPFLDLTRFVLAGGERGLLGLAFHPQFRTNRRFFVNYTRRRDGATVVAEFRASDDPNVALRAERRRLLTVPQPYANHNGGMLAFGLGGRLFIGLGDGGSAGDPQNLAQNRNVLLGKILRIDINSGQPYAIPPDNPFTLGGGRAEIFAWGFRNPWRFSFDRVTGQLYAGDVGQATVEEIDIVLRGSNYGWRIMEGDRCFNPATGCNRQGLKLPIATYIQTAGRCSVTGGYVYRGPDIPALVGTYIYGDFCTGEIIGLRGGQSTVLLDTGLKISSFGEDQAGELYVVDLQGTIHVIEPRAS